MLPTMNDTTNLWDHYNHNDFHITSKDISLQRQHVVLAVAALALSYILISLTWMRKGSSSSIPTYPSTIPIIKSTLAFVFDGLHTFQRIPQLFPNHETVKIEIVGDEFYIVQGAKNVAEMFRSPLLTVTRAYSVVLGQCFGMEQSAVDAYLADTSGSRTKPIEGSNPKPDERISHLTHENLVEGLLTSGLAGTTKNFVLNLQQNLEDLAVGEEWIAMPDLISFFEELVGTPLLQTLYGQRLLDENPDFAKDIWKYDDSVMDLARRVPSFWLPGAYAMRDKLLSAVRRWHSRGLAILDGSCLRQAPQEDPIWGTEFMKKRYPMLLNTSRQTKDSVASTNLALMWASVTNVVPSSAALLVNVLETPGLLGEVLEILDSSTSSPEIEDIEKDPLLLSIYAETLRLNVQIHIPRSAAHHDINIGGTVVPRNKLIMTNVMVAHMDKQVWNTQNGKHPVEDFWAERFIVDPENPSSGPVKGLTTSSQRERHFSTDGLEGVWIPFGGGQHACPGRLLARRIMLASLAMLLTGFEIELEQKVHFSSPRFGFGIRKPTGAVPFRIRRRRQ